MKEFRVIVRKENLIKENQMVVLLPSVDKVGYFPHDLNGFKIAQQFIKEERRKFYLSK